jgi:hypothetical protein
VARRRTGCIGLVALGSLILSACGTPVGPGVSGGAAKGVVTGRVTAGPTCPVERVGDPCPPKPVVAEVQAHAAGRVIASTRSSTDGMYRLKLRGGTYTVVATVQTVFPHCAPRTVTVIPAHTIRGDISCDTGIR